MDITLILELIVLFAALVVVNYDVKSKPLDRKVFVVWVIGTAVGYYFFSLYGAAVVLVLYLVWTRALLRFWSPEEENGD